MKKKTKFSLGMKIVTFLTVITMASVGFAAWVITAPVAPAEAEGSINVQQVYDESVTVTAKWVKRKADNSGFEDLGFDSESNPINPIIKYGMPETPIADAWLTNSDATYIENLEAYLCVTVTNNSSQKDAKLNLNFAPSDATEFDNAITDGLIGKPTFYLVNESDGKEVTGTTVYDYVDKDTKYELATVDKKANIDTPTGTEETFYIKIQFSWGSDVQNKNAYTYFNGEDYYTEGSNATTYLSELFDALNGVSYTATLSIATA